MFDFEKLEVYKKAKDLNKEVLTFIRLNKFLDNYVANQLQRASISIVINIAEGSGKFSKADKRNYYSISRGSVYECVSLLEIMMDLNYIDQKNYDCFISKYETISKMIMGLIKSQIKSLE